MSLDNFTPRFDDGRRILYEAECVSFMQSLPANSVDCIVTDPPYLISFMNRNFDQAHKGQQGQNEGQQMQAWHYAWAVEAWRCMKPGGMLAAFGGTRTFHRLACALEDAGWEIRDNLCWLFGSGFPKSANISKHLDKMAGAEREITGRYDSRSLYDGAIRQDHVQFTGVWNGGKVGGNKGHDLTAPATDAAKHWDGWGSSLKPCYEPILLCRKPLQGTLAQNVLRWNCGGLNIAASRLGTSDNLNGGAYAAKGTARHDGWGYQRHGGAGAYEQPSGRWPPNCLLQHDLRCIAQGTRRVQTGTAYGQNASAGHIYGNGRGLIAQEKGQETRGYADAQGYETVDAYQCYPSCPIGLLDQQAGERTSGQVKEGYQRHADTWFAHERGTQMTGYGDTAGA